MEEGECFRLLWNCFLGQMKKYLNESYYKNKCFFLLANFRSFFRQERNTTLLGTYILNWTETGAPWFSKICPLILLRTGKYSWQASWFQMKGILRGKDIFVFSLVPRNFWLSVICIFKILSSWSNEIYLGWSRIGKLIYKLMINLKSKPHS